MEKYIVYIQNIASFTDIINATIVEKIWNLGIFFYRCSMDYFWSWQRVIPSSQSSESQATLSLFNST